MKYLVRAIECGVFASPFIFIIAYLLSGTLMPFDLIAHLFFQETLLLLLVAIIFLFFKKRTVGLYGLGVATIMLAIVAPTMHFGTEEMPEPDLFFMNTYYYNEDHGPILETITRTQPETVALVEVHASFAEQVDDLYGEPLAYHDDRGLSMGVWTRRDDIVGSSIVLEPYTRIDVQFQEYDLMVLHPAPPTRQPKLIEQHEYFQLAHMQMNEFLDRESDKRLIVAGDFNSTPFSRTFRKYFSGLETTTYFTRLVGRPYVLAIDHVLSNYPLAITKTPELTSDHVGLFVSW